MEPGEPWIRVQVLRCRLRAQGSGGRVVGGPGIAEVQESWCFACVRRSFPGTVVGEVLNGLAFASEAAERLTELSAIVDRLVRVMQATYVPVWMRKPVPLLADDKPLDLIAAGDYRRVSRVVAGLEAPGAV